MPLDGTNVTASDLNPGSGAECFDHGWSYGLRPDPERTVSEWADEFRQLSQAASAEPGKWRTARTPYLRAIMDALSNTHDAEDVVFMKGAQLGGTEAGNNWIGYVVDQAPGPMMVVQPTVEMAKRWSKQRLARMLEDTPRLAERVSDAKSRDSGNTLLMKEFRGGVLVITGANSASGLRSMPVRYLFMDELDAYPLDVDEEGDPVALAEKRTETFTRRKRFKVSTPTVRGRSRIEREYEASTKARYYVPCPHCRERQVLVWGQIRWEDDDPGTAYYECAHCKEPIHEHHKTWMLDNGEWIEEAPGKGKAKGFQLSSLYSPVGWFSWRDAVKAWLAAQKDTRLLKVFVNTVLAETWVDRGEAPDWEVLWLRRGGYRRREVPWGVVFLTAGVDVQADRLEVSIYGWGRWNENWLIDHVVLVGDTAQEAVWLQLDQLMAGRYQHACGAMLPVLVTAVDSGFRPQEVYRWSRKYHGTNRVIVVKGVDSAPTALGRPTLVDVKIDGKRIRRGVRLWPVGVSVIKSDLYGWLRKSPPEDPSKPFPSGYCHHPEDLDQEFFKQKVAEQLVEVQTKKGVHREWQKLRDRNEALDCAVYAYAAACAVGIERFHEETWQEFERHQGIEYPETEGAPDAPPQPQEGGAEEEGDDDDPPPAPIRPARPARRPRRRGPGLTIKRRLR